jgi:hypothetical protein
MKLSEKGNSWLQPRQQLWGMVVSRCVVFLIYQKIRAAFFLMLYNDS